jgi:phosphoglycerate dehydrogenase-like enzyme
MDAEARQAAPNRRHMSFKIGISADFLNDAGEIGWGDIGLSMLDDHPGHEWEFLPDFGDVIPAAVADDYDAVLLLAPRITAETVADPKRLKIVARFGVGYDSVDVEACTRAGVAVTITPDSVRRPVAVGTVALILAMTHNVVVKDRLTRAGRWDEKLRHMGTGVTDRMLGIIGLGNIGREVVRVSQSLGFRYQAHNPYPISDRGDGLPVPLVGLEQLLRTSDIVCITARLIDETRNLIGADQLALMKPDAYLVNMGRGPIVDEPALVDALRSRRIRGAALDVFEQEPPAPDNPLFALENVTLTPHAIAWTDESAIGNGRSALQSILDVAAGRVPGGILNPEALSVKEQRA